MSDGLRIRPVTPRDYQALHRLNGSATPAVNAVGTEFWPRMATIAALFLGAVRNGSLSGFLLALPPGTEYESENYRWFNGRYDDFIYIDRIVVKAAEHGHGVGSALYRALDAMASGRRLCCEVNLWPPNEQSLRFHRRHGFHIVGERVAEAGGKRVAFLAR